MTKKFNNDSAEHYICSMRGRFDPTTEYSTYERCPPWEYPYCPEIETPPRRPVKARFVGTGPKTCTLQEEI